MTEELRVGEYEGWILTANGMRIDYINPEPSQITILDIAHSLGNLCRFTGGTKHFYSVAQHSLFVSKIVYDLLKGELTAEEMETTAFYDQMLAALLHDAAEAYINDLASPLKQVINGRYAWVEHGLTKAIFERYGVDMEYKNNIVKDADNIACMHERYFMLPAHKDWPVDKDRVQYEAPQYVGPAEAGQLFMQAFQSVMVKRNAARAEARRTGEDQL